MSVRQPHTKAAVKVQGKGIYSYDYTKWLCLSQYLFRAFVAYESLLDFWHPHSKGRSRE